MRSINLPVPNGNLHILEADRPVPTQETQHLPVVFVHGMACSASIWDAQLAYVAQTRRAIAIDLRGHGTSSAPSDENYLAESCASDLLAVLAALQLDRIALVGHSFGACVALAAAAMNPNSIEHLILVDPPIDCTQCPADVYQELIAPFQTALTTENWRAAMEASFLNALSGSTPATKNHILDRLAATPKGPLIGTSQGLFAFKAVAALDRYLAVPGSRAHAILAPTNNLPFSLHVLRPTLPTITIPDTGHWLMLDAPEAFAQALHTCLSS